MDALSLLKKDHENVKRMLEELDATTERGVKTPRGGSNRRGDVFEAGELEDLGERMEMRKKELLSGAM